MYCCSERGPARALEAAGVAPGRRIRRTEGEIVSLVLELVVDVRLDVFTAIDERWQVERPTPPVHNFG